MGASLPKAVEPIVIERQGTKRFDVAVAEMNGWRTNMEDAHLIFPREDYGVFGVFDGHGGGACSEFVAKRLEKELEEKGCPEDDETVKKLFLDVDKEFLDTAQSSGTTATMCIVRKPTKSGEKHRLHVINAGDSRVLLGRRDGTIVDGGGTDKGLTTDHKPDHPDERKRIERCGGTVEMAAGNVARVNGNLAVSRGFGDSGEKQTGGPGLEERPVTANPEMGHFECDEADFLLLVCDGVSEGNFPNAEVVQLVADLLREGKNAGEAATAVCRKAEEMDSKDNITCMVVLLSGAASETPRAIEFIPGPILKVDHKGFREAYTAMAKKAGLSMAQAAALRYEALQTELAANPTDDLRAEAAKIGTPGGAPKSEERVKWFEKWLNEIPEAKDEGPGGMDMDSLEAMLGKGSGRGGGGKAKGGGRGAGKAAGGYAGAAEAENDKEIERNENGYSWSQKGDEVQVIFKLPTPATKKDVKVSFKLSSLTVNAHDKVLLDGPLGGAVDTDDCTWCIAGGGSELQVMLTKKNSSETWSTLIK
eukprot:TRINITY_DN54956_c0_g1_i1.p1 TRINITY_DN54956_c0_g1~~TRINITY_DN54956_c0_g1_i1.p1  ORF type:complete len:552 (+),score=127.13 TRINITY_DN54956_c0_g1_i1:55-1656(+)